MNTSLLIERIYRSLKTLPIELDAYDVMDAAWLSAILQSNNADSGAMTNRTTTDECSQNSTSGKSTQIPSNGNNSEKRSTGFGQNAVHACGYGESTLKLRGDSVGLPAVPSLPQSLLLERGLRSLARKVDSKRDALLDERATAEASAEAGRLQLRFIPKKQRSLSAVLLIESSPTMRLWCEPLRGISKLFWRVGAFHTLETFYLNSFDSPPSLFSDRELRRRVKTSRVVASGERHCVFLVTDGRSTSWFDGTMQQLLREWNQLRRTVLLSVVSSAMWNRTVFQNPQLLSGRLKGPLGPVQLISEHEADPVNYIPLIPFTPDQIGRLGHLIWGDCQSIAACFHLHSEAMSTVPARPTAFTPTTELGTSAFEKFIKTATPEAINVARSFASIPLYLPILRLTQHCLHANTGLSHFAEIMWSGMIYRRDYKNPISPNTDADSIEFDFLPGIRDRLLNQVSVDRVANVFDILTRFLAQHAGYPKGRGAILDNPEGIIEWAQSGLPDNQKPFARIASHVLQRLGGDYDRAGHELDRLVNSELEPLDGATLPASEMANKSVIESIAGTRSNPSIEELPYDFADIEMEDGTNLPKGTKYRVNDRIIHRNLYVPAVATPSKRWQQSLRNLQRRLTQVASNAQVRLHASQLRIPEFPGRSSGAWLGDTNDMLFFSFGSSNLGKGFGSLLDERGVTLFGLFPFSDAAGEPIENSVGEPFALRYGASRSVVVYGDRIDTKLFEDASKVLYELPPNLATRIWRNWPEGFAVEAFDQKELWLNALLEFGWDLECNDPLSIPRYAMSDDLETKILLTDKGLFPRIPQTCSKEAASKVAHENGFPVEIYSEIQDVLAYSTGFLERLLQIERDATAAPKQNRKQTLKNRSLTLESLELREDLSSTLWVDSFANDLNTLSNRNLVYLSFSYEDDEYRHELRSILKQDNEIGKYYFDDLEVPPGADWDIELQRAVSRARVMIMLVSPRYLDHASCQAWKYEIPSALEASEKGELTILWLATQPVQASAVPFANIQACVPLSRPLESLTADERIEVYMFVRDEAKKGIGPHKEFISRKLKSQYSDQLPLSAIPNAQRDHIAGKSDREPSSENDERKSISDGRESTAQERLPYEFADVEVEDGTNVPKGTKYRTRERRIHRDLHVPSKAMAAQNWQIDYAKLLQRFVELSSTRVSIRLRSSQLRIPESPGRSTGTWIGESKDMLFGGFGSMNQEKDSGPLIDEQGRPLFGLFPFTDAGGRPIQNTVGEPFAWRYEYSRSVVVYGSPIDITIFDDASKLLSKLPAELATRIWTNWPEGFSAKAFERKELWFNALLEFGWEQEPDDPLKIPRYAQSEDLQTRIQLLDKGLFPRIPPTASKDDISRIKHEFGFPVEIHSEIQDVINYSKAFLQRLISGLIGEPLKSEDIDSTIEQLAKDSLANGKIPMQTQSVSPETALLKQRPSILIVGSYNARQPSSERKAFERACQELGKELVHSGFTIVCSSSKPSTADYHVLIGASQTGVKGKVILVRPTASIEADDFEKTVLSKFEVERQFIRGRQADARQAQIVAANLIIAIGGATGTKLVMELAEESRKLVIPVGAFGGAVVEQWDRQANRLFDGNDLEKRYGILRDRFDAKLIVKLIAELDEIPKSLSRFKQQSKPVSAVGESHSGSALQKRFKVALSFPGEERKFVEELAEYLAGRLSKQAIFFDEWYEVELLGTGGDLKLSNMYKDAELIVPFFSKHYDKPWCQLEWETIREILLTRRRDDAVIPVHMDDTAIPGWTAVNFGIRRKSRSPQEIGQIVLDAIELRSRRLSSDASQSRENPKADSTNLPRQRELAEELMDYLTNERDVETNKSSRKEIDRRLAELKAYIPKLVTQPTELDQRRFLRASFVSICEYFVQAGELFEKSNARVNLEWSKIDAEKFRCEMFVDGRQITGCRIWIGTGSFDSGIHYFQGREVSNEFNARNETLVVDTSSADKDLRLKGVLGISASETIECADAQTVAQILWKRFVKQLES